ncbi:hypothetical protein N0V94_003173 [Neodidymelliopsis sp. IMI 364377]|nr:hypothetical protein N0V94_003173 [Neodidymelliopsis sp. IMI 364377]
MQYLNEPEFQQGFKAVSERIRDRLQLMERIRANEYMRQTDDYWYKWSILHKKEDATLKDVATEKYKSIELVEKWVPWINNFIVMRVQKVENLLGTLYANLNDDWNEASMYTDLEKSGQGRTYEEDESV